MADYANDFMGGLKTGIDLKQGKQAQFQAQQKLASEQAAAQKQMLMQQAKQAYDNAASEQDRFLNIAGNEKYPPTMRQSAWNNAAAISKKLGNGLALPAIDKWDDVAADVANALGVDQQRLAKGEIDKKTYFANLRDHVAAGMKAAQTSGDVEKVRAIEKAALEQSNPDIKTVEAGGKKVSGQMVDGEFQTVQTDQGPAVSATDDSERLRLMEENLQLKRDNAELQKVKEARAQEEQKRKLMQDYGKGPNPEALGSKIASGVDTATGGLLGINSKLSMQQERKEQLERMGVDFGKKKEAVPKKEAPKAKEKAPAADDGKVAVVAPDGRTGKIPKAKLKEYQKKGFKLISAQTGAVRG